MRLNLNHKMVVEVVADLRREALAAAEVAAAEATRKVVSTEAAAVAAITEIINRFPSRIETN